ncbi:hypothetical protein [Croceicoccus mobilis]|uniref:Uncharacterized protein n=1 Tax=Croceicoccus mobilis TaxID=1703339 RepID=A0A917DPY5_9SPHN|nr:hypothetical protein [Croceicoccus mobilis]GGD55541.1 hypothetical protein GCM10010990_00840 [Croceicoccus mobilis]
MRVFRFLRRFNTVAAAILLVIGIIAALLVMGLAGGAMAGTGLGAVGSGSYSASGESEGDDVVAAELVNVDGKAGPFLLYHRGSAYSERLRDLMLLDAATGRHRRLFDDPETTVARFENIRDTGLILYVRAEETDADPLLDGVFVRFSDFRSFTIAKRIRTLDVGRVLDDGRVSFIISDAAGDTKFEIFDVQKGEAISSKPIDYHIASDADGRSKAPANQFYITE